MVTKKILKEKLTKLNYSKIMVNSCLQGKRKPNAEIRNKLRDIIPFEMWGENIKEYFAAQNSKETCKEKL